MLNVDILFVKVPLIVLFLVAISTTAPLTTYEDVSFPILFHEQYQCHNMHNVAMFLLIDPS